MPHICLRPPPGPGKLKKCPVRCLHVILKWRYVFVVLSLCPGGGGGVHPYKGYMGMCHPTESCLISWLLPKTFTSSLGMKFKKKLPALEDNRNGCSIGKLRALQRTGGWKNPWHGWQKVRRMTRRWNGNSIFTHSEIGIDDKSLFCRVFLHCCLLPDFIL